MVSRTIWQTNIYIFTARGRNFRRWADGIWYHNLMIRLFFNNSTFQLLLLQLKIVSKWCQVRSPSWSGVVSDYIRTSFAPRRAYLQENQGSWTSCRLTKNQSADTFVCTAMILDVALKYGRTCRNHNRDSLPASRKRRPIDDLMLYQRRRRWSSIYKYRVNISLLLGSHKMSLVSQNEIYETLIFMLRHD